MGQWSVWRDVETDVLLSVGSVVKTLSSSVCLVNVMSSVVLVPWNMYRVEVDRL